MESLKQSFVKLNPRVMIKNPIMFTVELVTLVMLVVCILSLGTSEYGTFGYNFLVFVILFVTLLFANFAEAIAEARGKAQADSLRKTREETPAKVLVEGKLRTVSSARLKKGDFFVCEAGDTIPADGEIVEGLASIDESAITGESAPVIREAGGDKSSVTGGTKVLSDKIRCWLRSNHRPSLFWRTFILLCGLIFFSVVGWLQSFRVLSELPYSQGVAQHIVSTANLTKYALVTADPLFRVDLLKLLAAREGLLLSPRDATDKVVVLSGDGFNGLIEQLVKHQLGQDTILASSVNGVSGLWVSVDIDGDAYWMQTDSGILNPPLGTAWLWWALAACLASLFGATLLTRHVIDPLAKLSQVAAQLGQGKVPDPLPEDAGTAEIQAVNMSFNRMVQDLRRMEADRELLLAGVSHDLRTPITRLRLEVELADLPEDSRTAMVSDLEQMENIVNQFLSYARHSHEEQELVNLGEAVQNAMSNARLASDSTVKITSHIAPNVFIVAHPLELSRAVQNLFTNAMRYGRSEDGILRLHITTGLTDNGKNAMLTVGDEGAGLPEDQRERVMRPFERGESARSGVTGTGLGLAIVDRIVRRSSGSVQLDSMDPHGLLVRVGFPAADPAAIKAKEEKRAREQEKLEKKMLKEFQKNQPAAPADHVDEDPKA